MRTLIFADPLVDPSDATYRFEASPWPARWVGPASPGVPGAWAYRLRFTLGGPAAVRLHVTADERYELFLDGVRLGRGPERGDLANWFYETYDVAPGAGDHALVARVWSLGELAPLAQVAHRPAFLLMAERSPVPLDTGVAAWQVAALDGYAFAMPRDVPGFVAVGARADVDGRRHPWGVERGDDAGCAWRAAADVGPATVKSAHREAVTPWMLRPATLPAMRDEPVPLGVVRHVADAASFDAFDAAAVDPAGHRVADAAAWQAMLEGGGVAVVPPRTTRRVLVDLRDYACAHATLTLSGGRDAVVRVRWAESLYDDVATQSKGDRDAVDGKRFVGMGSTFVADGGDRRAFAPLWWDAGRHVALDVATADAPLTVESFALRATGYPHRHGATFAASDDRLAAVVAPALATLDACSHETFVDCPYYEQLAYVGDARLEALVTYATTRDDRLPRKTIELFDASRGPDGWTRARHPSRRWQRIAPFSLWWVAAVHDLALWRGDERFVRARLPGVRAVLEAARAHVTDDALFACPPGWNFVDWAWPRGVPPGGGGDWGVKAAVHWQAAIAFDLAAELEGSLGDPSLAERNATTAADLAAAGERAFWDAPRGLYADDAEHRHFSEHGQCLPAISGLADAGRTARAIATLIDAPPDALARASVYFSHYLFEAFRLTGRVDALVARLGFWFDLGSRGLRTLVESPEPARSDCHAWGAHPVFHFHATVLGVRPQALGMTSVRVEPQLGPLAWARGTMPHPGGGTIGVDARRDGGRLTGVVELPDGVEGTLHANGEAREIGGGRTTF